MSGLDALKAALNKVAEEKKEEKKEETAPPVQSEPAKPVVEQKAAPVQEAVSVDTNYPELMGEFEQQTVKTKYKPSTTFVGIGGHSGRGKTGIAMDAFVHYAEEDEMMWCMDFDSGALECKQTHYPDDERFRIWNPWSTQVGNRTAFDYPKTHQRTMDICKFALEYAQKQRSPDWDKPRLKAFLVTAVDQFDQVCINNMKIYDLEMDAKDAIEAAASKLNKEIGWNWNIRSTRFKQLTALCRQMNHLGVDVYWETHIKSGDDEYSHDGWKFVWEKQANNDLTQILWCKDIKVRDEDGKETGETRYAAEFVKCKTNPNLQGQERTFFVTKKGQNAEWYGLPELRDRTL
jgi:hypothetical protein